MAESDYDIILIVRRVGRMEWDQVTNPTDTDIRMALPFLDNPFNEYVEYFNTGVAHRYIRRKDLHKYGLYANKDAPMLPGMGE